MSFMRNEGSFQGQRVTTIYNIVFPSRLVVSPFIIIMNTYVIIWYYIDVRLQCAALVYFLIPSTGLCIIREVIVRVSVHRSFSGSKRTNQNPEILCASRGIYTYLYARSAKVRQPSMIIIILRNNIIVCFLITWTDAITHHRWRFELYYYYTFRTEMSTQTFPAALGTQTII